MLLVGYPEGELIELDKAASQIDRFTNNEGTDLLAGEDQFHRGGIRSFPQLSEDGRAAMVEITGPSRPV